MGPHAHAQVLSNGCGGGNGGRGEWVMAVKFRCLPRGPVNIGQTSVPQLAKGGGADRRLER